MNEEKLKALEIARRQIEHQFGKGAIMRLGERAARMDVEVIPTGSIALDAALGIGGLPRGRVVEIFGPEGSGKTTLALHVAAEAQRRGGIVAFIDAEQPMLKNWELIRKTCIFPSLIQEKTLWKSPRFWSEVTPLTSLL